MNAVKTDNPLEKQIYEYRNKVQALEHRMQAFMSSYQGLPAKERAKLLGEVQRNIQSAQRFFETFQIALVTNAGAKFVYDNAKSSFQTLLGRWRKFEALL